MFKLIQLRAESPFAITGTIYDSVCVGRGTQNELHSQDRLISTNHARIFVRGGALQIADLDSRNGTEVNGERLTPFDAIVLKPGDHVDFAGRLAFRVEVEHDGMPVIEIQDQHEEVPEDDSILRVLALPEGHTPHLDATRLLTFNTLLQKLLDPTLQRNGARWIRQLTEGLARALKVNEIHLLTLRSGQPERLFPDEPSVPTRVEALRAALEREQSLSVELSTIDPSHGLSSTVDPSSLLVFSVLVGVIPGAHAAPSPWGLLYATTEGLPGRRVFGEAEIYLLDTFSRLTGTLLPQVSFQQVIARHRPRYRKLRETARSLGIVGRSAILGATLEALSALAAEPGPVLLQAHPRGGVTRWAQLYHQLSSRSQGRWLELDARRPDGDLDTVARAATGGSLFIAHADALDDDRRQQLLALLRDGLGKRSQLITHAPVGPRALRDVLGRELVDALAPRCLRVPPLSERPADRPALITHLLGALGAPDALGPRALELFCRLRTPGDYEQLQGDLRDALQATPDRPVTLEHLTPDGVDASPYAARIGPPLNEPDAALIGFHPLAPEPPHPVPLGPLAHALSQAGLLE